MKPVDARRAWAVATEPSGFVCLNFSPRVCVEQRVNSPSRCSGNRRNPLKPDTCAAEDRPAAPGYASFTVTYQRAKFGHSTINLEDAWNPLSI
jgi:hypothetical protein